MMSSDSTKGGIMKETATRREEAGEAWTSRRAGSGSIDPALRSRQATSAGFAADWLRAAARVLPRGRSAFQNNRAHHPFVMLVPPSIRLSRQSAIFSIRDYVIDR